MKKLVFLLLLVPCFLFIVSACQGNNKSGKSTSISVTNQPQQEATDNKITDQTQTSQQGESASSTHSWFSGITSQVIVVSIFFALLFSFLLLLFITKFLRRDIDYNLKNYVKSKISTANFTNQNTRKPYNQQELQGLQEKITHLEGYIKRLNERINSLDVGTKIKEPQQLTQQSDQQPIPKPETFYLSTPNSDNSFNESSKSSAFREGSSIYSFTKTSENTAVFELVQKASTISFALRFYNKNIEPVCDSENEYETKFNSVKTLQKGEAELQNDKWVVTKKAKIRYE